MVALINLMGQRLGRWTVIDRVNNNKIGTARWLCKCDCGKERIIRGSDLRYGSTKSCGCLQKLSSGISNMRKLIRNYKNRAKIMGFEWDLTEEQFKEITQRDCHYCGIKPNGIVKTIWYNGDYIYNGIDRIDNNKGYTIDNVVPCCKICNYAKRTKTLQEYQDWIKRSYNKIFNVKDKGCD
jgi:hypothetical protein